MNFISKYFFLQAINFWKDLSFRLRLEIVILIIIYFTYFTSRMINYSNELLMDPEATAGGLVYFTLHIFVLIISITIPFIHLYLIPKQKNLAIFRTIPLDIKNSFLLLLLYHLKYQLIGFMIFHYIY